MAWFGLFGTGRSRIVHVDRFGEPLTPRPTAARAPAPTTTPRRGPERPTVARRPAMTSEAAADVVAAFLAHEGAQAIRTPCSGLPAPMGATVAAALARTPPPAPRPQPAPTTQPVRTNVDRLLSMTTLGQSALRLRKDREREAAARTPAPIGAEVRRGLAATHTGRSVLAERVRLDPTGEAQAAGLDPARRRELLEGSTLGRAMLAEEARHPRRVGEE